MRSRRRDLRSLVGDELPPEELKRLERVHKLLLAAGARPRDAATPVPPLAHRSSRRLAGLAAFAALVGALFGGGFLIGSHQQTQQAGIPVRLHSAVAGLHASAQIWVAPADAAGNRTLLVRAQGLRPLPRDGHFELFLTRAGRPTLSCGRFLAGKAFTSVRLNAPYSLRGFDGWAVTAQPPGAAEPGPIILRGPMPQTLVKS